MVQFECKGQANSPSNYLWGKKYRWSASGHGTPGPYAGAGGFFGSEKFYVGGAGLTMAGP